MKELVESSEMIDETSRAHTEALNLFPELTNNQTDRFRVYAGAGVLALAVSTAVLYKTGVDLEAINQTLDKKLVLNPPVATEIVDGMVFVNESLRGAAPLVLAGGLGVRITQRLRAKGDYQQATIEKLAGMDYSGADEIAEQSEQGRSSIGVRRKSRAFVAGLGVATMTALFAGGSSGVEHEVSNGPLRPVERIFNDFSAAGPKNERQIIVQTETATFMSDSYLEKERTAALVEEAAEEDVTIVPFGKSLSDIDGRSGLVLSIPDELFAQRAGLALEVGSDGCENISIILDEANSTPVGGHTDINGVRVVVAGKISDTAQMNRDVAIISESHMEECIQGTDDGKYFGAIVSGTGAGQFMVDRKLLGSGNSMVVSQETFEENNRGFWRKNGTPILLELILYGGAIGAFAIGSERRAALLRHVREIGTLNATGVSIKNIRAIETRRALKDTAKATMIAAPLMPLMAAAFNAAEVGLKVGVGVREIAVGYTVALAAKLTGTLRAVRKFSKNLNLPEAVKG